MVAYSLFLFIMENVVFKGVEELIDGLNCGLFSSVELTKTFIERVKATDGDLKSFLSFDEEKTLREASQSDKRRVKNELLSCLDGIPVGLKDIFAESGQPLTCASKILKDFVSPYDSTVVSKLRKAGVVLFGRLNMDEFAMGSSSENSAFQETANPWDIERVPGGSSSGSAAAVAARQMPLSLGTDTGGSIRQPASLCGIVGIKPTYGRVSRYGIVAYASSLDQAGPFGKSVNDVANLLQVISGFDSKDSTSSRKEVPNFVDGIKRCETGTIGIPKEYFGEGLDNEVRESIFAAIKFYEKAGWRVKEVTFPSMEYAVPVYYIVANAEASSNLARYDGVRYTHRASNLASVDDMYSISRDEGFGKEVKRRILLGTYVLSSGYYDSFYGKAQKLRTLIYRDFIKAFESVDALITPTSPFPAFKRGEKASNPLAMYLSDIYTISVNLAGLPGMSIPCGFTKSGLPIGMQIIGRPFDEVGIMAMANFFEKSHDFNTKAPNI